MPRVELPAGIDLEVPRVELPAEIGLQDDGDLVDHHHDDVGLESNGGSSVGSTVGNSWATNPDLWKYCERGLIGDQPCRPELLKIGHRVPVALDGALP